MRQILLIFAFLLSGLPAFAQTQIGGGGSSVSPNTSTVPGIYAGASPYNAKFDGRTWVDGVLNGTTTVTSATLSCTNADIGKLIFAVNAANLSKLNTTVASCSGASFITTAAATASESGDTLTICSDDTTALTNSFNAAFAANVPLYLPAGQACVTSRPWFVSIGAVAAANSNQTIVVQGAGMNATVIGMTPGFSFAGLTTGTIFENNSTAWTCTWLGNGVHEFNVTTLEDFSVTGYGFNFPSWPAQMPILSRACQVHRVGIYANQSLVMIGVSAPQESYVDNTNIQGIGGTGILMTGPGSVAVGNIIAFTSGPAFNVTNCNNANCSIIGGFTTGTATGVKVVNSFVEIADITIQTGSANTGVSVDGTSTVNLSRVALVQSGISTSVGINIAAGGKLRTDELDNIVLSGTPTEIINAGSFFDACGNNLTGTITNTGSWFGTCSVTGTALVSGNLVPSANWGTSAAISAPVGDSQFFSFTLTNGSAAVGANPTIAFTFPTVFPRNPICTIQQVGGTQAILAATAILTPSAISGTGITLTYNGTPTVNLTEFYQGECH